MTTLANNAVASQQPSSPKRRGVVLIAVLIVVVLLSLAAYQFGDLMLREYKVSDSAHRVAQARSSADSGIHYAAAMLCDTNLANLLNGNPWNNSAMFRGINIPGDGTQKCFFTIISPPDPDDASTNYRYGVSDESGKINLNALMKLDATGSAAYAMLMKLPNMTDYIASSIVNWMLPVANARAGGAQSDYYTGLTPPMQCKNGPIDSIHELLLVAGVTFDLLYGNDLNRNGIQDPDEDAPNGFSRGWSAFLTVNSREVNVDSEGNPYINLNNQSADLTQVYPLLSTELGDPLAKFIIIYLQNGPTQSSSSTTTGTTQSGGGVQSGTTTGGTTGGGKGGTTVGGQGGTSSSQASVKGDLGSLTLDLTVKPKTQMKSMFELVNAQVTVQSKDDKGKTVNTVYASPLSDVDSQRDLLPKLFQYTTLTAQTEIPARINVTTAPREVIAAIPNLQDGDVDKIMSIRPKLSATDAPAEIFQTPAWLLTEAQISLSTLQQLDSYVTARTQVYRVQAVGYFEGNGPAARVEAVIDINGGKPRIVAWRNLSELGRGWTDAAP